MIAHVSKEDNYVQLINPIVNVSVCIQLTSHMITPYLMRLGMDMRLIKCSNVIII